ncbi:hypothetical protein SteCoe_848 [Stentor coeruleus]|uniref:RRM domain-containing protein n=1 Tax=Stentor coeruleus TaxID=5963 RepID=A0A1R2D3C3_9CILI|nr:hypothetical protein SteCoe_848 [Stentor coeruleus]
MEKPKPLCWADFSEDETSDTEELTPLCDPNKKLLLDTINSSSQPLYNFKIENLPYTITTNEEILSFLDLCENEATIRMQYKGKKFTGFALLVAKTKDIALAIAMKFGSNYNGRPVLIYYKPNENSQWIPQKKMLEPTGHNTTFSMTPRNCIENYKKKPTNVDKNTQFITPKIQVPTKNFANDILRDTAIISAWPKKYKGKFTR